MPTPAEVLTHLQQFGEESPFYTAMNEDAKRVASEALDAHRRIEMDNGQPDPYDASPEQTVLMYQDFLQRAQKARGIAPKVSLAVQRAQTVSQPTADTLWGGIKKGLTASDIGIKALTMAPFVSEEESMQNFAFANKRQSEVEGPWAKAGSIGARTGGDMLPVIGGSLLTGGAAAPILGANAARGVGLTAASLGAGTQVGVPEYYDRRAQGMDPTKAAQIAATKGMTTAAITAIMGLTGVEALANPVTREALRGGFRNYMKIAAVGGRKEGLEEAGDEAFSGYIDAKMAGDEITPIEFLERLGTAAGLGIVFGSGSEVASAAFAPKPPTPPGARPPAAPDAPAPVAPDIGRNLGSVLRKVRSGEITPQDLQPAHAALMADLMREQHASKKIPSEDQVLIDALDARSGITPPAPKAKKPAAGVPTNPAAAAALAEAQAPAASPEILAGVKALVEQMQRAKEALEESKSAPAPKRAGKGPTNPAAAAALAEAQAPAPVAPAPVAPAPKRAGKGPTNPAAAAALAEAVAAAPAPVAPAPAPVAPAPAPVAAAPAPKRAGKAPTNPAAAAALAEAEAQPATATAVAPQQEVSSAEEVRPVQEEASRQEQGQEADEGQEPFRQVKGRNATLDERGANAFEAAIKYDPVALAQYVRKVGVRGGTEANLRADIREVEFRALDRAERIIEDKALDPESSRAEVIRERFLKAANEHIELMKADWAVALTAEQVVRARAALVGKGALADRAVQLLDEQAARSAARPVEQEGGSPLPVQTRGERVTTDAIEPKPYQPAEDARVSGTAAPVAPLRVQGDGTESRVEVSSPIVRAPAAELQAVPPTSAPVTPTEAGRLGRLGATRQTREVAKQVARTVPTQPAVLGRGGVVQEATQPEVERRDVPFGVHEDPESPAFIQKIRDSISDEISRQAIARGRPGTVPSLRSELRSSTDELGELAAAAAEEMNRRKTYKERRAEKQAARRASKKQSPQHYDEEVVNELAAEAREVKQLAEKVAPILRKTVVEAEGSIRIGYGQGQSITAPIYAAPGGWTKVIDEYLDLYAKDGAVIRQESEVARVKAIHRIATEKHDAAINFQASGQVIAHLKGEKAKASAEVAATEKELAKRIKTKGAPTPESRKRMHELSNGIRANMAESVADQMASYLRAQPGSERRTVAKRFEDVIQRGLVGLGQDMENIIFSGELADPSTLRGANRRVFIAEVRPGEFMAVTPHRKNRGEYSPLNQQGEPIDQFRKSRGEEPSTIQGNRDEPGERIAQGKSIGDVRASIDFNRDVTPFITSDLTSLIDLVQTRDLELPQSAKARASLNWMMQNGFGIDIKDQSYKIGAAEPAVMGSRAEGRAILAERAHRGRITDLTARPFEVPGTYLNRVLYTPSNEATNTEGDYIAKRVDAKLLRKELEKNWGAEGIAELENAIRVEMVKKDGDTYVTKAGALSYKRDPQAPVGASNETPQHYDRVLSQQRIAELLAQLFDIDARIGAKHGISLPEGTVGAYDARARIIVAGQFDVPAILHELFHDLTMHEIRSNRVPHAVQRELLAVAKATGQHPLISEGAAELGAQYAKDPDAIRSQYPDAVSWLEALLDAQGTKDRIDRVGVEYRKRLAATPQERARAAIVTKNEADKRAEGESRVGSVWWRAWNSLNSALFDQMGFVNAIARRMFPVLSANDSMYNHKMTEAGWASAADDAIKNGFVLNAATQERTASFGDVLFKAKELGVTGDRFNDWQGWLKTMSILDSNPRLRRQVFRAAGLDEALYGDWAIPGSQLPDPFDTVAEIQAENAKITADYEAKVLFNKAASVPPPPKPKLYSEKSPTPGSSSEAPADYTAEQVADFVDLVKGHKLGTDYHTLNDLHMAAVNAFDDYRFMAGQLTNKDRSSHRMRNYYVPQRTEIGNSVAVKIKGGGGADTVAPYEALFDKIATAYWHQYSQGSFRALLRATVAERERRREAGTQHDEDLDPISTLASFSSFDEALKDAELKKENISAVEGEYATIGLDEETLDALLDAGLIDLTKHKDPNTLIGTRIRFRIQDAEVRKVLETPAIPWNGGRTIFRAAKMPATAIRKLSTTFNPEYMLKSMIRDPAGALLQTATGRNPIRYLESTSKGIMDAYTAAGQLVNDRAKTDPIYSAYVQSGVTSVSMLHEADTVQNVLTNGQLRDVLNRVGVNKPRFGFLRSPLNTLARASDTNEGFSRAGEFRRSIDDQLMKMGKQRLNQLTPVQAKSVLMQAARHAQEVTVNFRRIGRLVADPALPLNHLIPFFNAAIQGTRRGVQTLTFQQRFPGETVGQRALNGGIVYSLLLMGPLLQHMFLQDDPEDRDEYMQLPDNERMLFYHIPTGADAAGKRRFAKIPKPQGIFTGVIAAFEKMFEDDPRTWNDVGWDMFKQSTPQAYVPTIFQLGIELFSGERVGTTASRILVPDRLKKAENELQTAPWISPTSELAHEILPWISPLDFENLVRGYTGGLGWVTLDLPQAVKHAMGADERASYDVGSYPLIRLFNTQDPAFASRSITRMYDLLGVVESGESSYKSAVKEVEQGMRTPEQLAQLLEEKPDVAFGHGASTELADFRSQMSKARIFWENTNRDKSLTPVQRRIKMDELVDLIVHASQTAFETVTGVSKEITGKEMNVPRR